jgi:hypothetical protein
MAGGTDIERLRALVERVAESLVDSCTHDALGKACEDLGLLSPPSEAEPGSEQDPSKRQRVA